MNPFLRNPLFVFPLGKAISEVCQHKQRVSFFLNALSLVFLIWVGGCSSSPLKPIVENHRHIISFLPFEDISGTYTTLSKPLELLTSSILSGDFVETIELSAFGNMNVIRKYPNPFKPVLNGNVSNAQFIVRGEVERLSYEPVKNIKGDIVNFALFGLLWLAFSGDDDMGAYLQYRIYISDDNGTPIDSFVTIGASYGEIDKVSRKQLMDEANSVAAYELSARLLKRLMEKYNWNLPSRIEDLSKDKFRNIRLYYFLMEEK